MKIYLFLAISMALAFMACTNSDDDLSPSGSGGNNSNNTTNAPQGDWTVNYYWDKDKEETSDFSGYHFEFQDDGTLLATKSGTEYLGTWSKNSSSSKLVLSISGTKALDDMTDDWLILEMTASSIKLKDDNTEHLEELYLGHQ